MKLVVPSLRTTVFRMDRSLEHLRENLKMKRVMTIVFASMVALTLSMPAWSQAKPATPTSQTAKDKEAAKKKKQADREAAKKKKEAEKAAKAAGKKKK